jgi:uncharacterized protein (TIGR02266 family)
MNPQDKPIFPAVQKDQRSTLRIPLIIEKIPCDDGQKTFFGYARNLSRGGVFIPTVNPREPGAQFDLHITLPSSAGFELRCRGEVVWVRRFERDGKHPPGMGLRFVDLPQETADTLERWLRSLPAE